MWGMCPATRRLFSHRPYTTYALVLVLVTVAVIGVLTQLGVTLEGKINNIIDSLGG